MKLTKEQLAFKLSQLEKENLDLELQLEELEEENLMLKDFLKENGMIVESITGEDTLLVRGKYTVKIKEDMDEFQIQSMVEHGQKVLNWLRKNNVELTDKGDVDEN